MGYKQIVFDVDGTLIDTEYASLHSLQDTIRQLLQRTIPLPELRFAMYLTDAETLRKLGIQDVRHGTEVWHNYYFRKYLSAICLFEEISDVLAELKKNHFGLGIITSETRPEWQNHIRRFHLEEFFDTVICAEDTVRHKPDPEPMQLYLQRTGVTEKDVLFIGDSLSDRQCAFASGVDFGFARWSRSPMPEKQATYTFHHPSDIPRLLSRGPGDDVRRL
ncbi:HAD family hydrolase [Sporolactobacillus vineae]|uniref:HAD family hydrolase n=1 Tax=Sporolactobacillus vineae TaxID=444463 RepID=UPI000289B683|nr:HAD family hydrolase [Sporolactobacillus vineae]